VALDEATVVVLRQHRRRQRELPLALERHGAVTRRGRDGVDQVDTRGLVTALFRQHTSRTADPQLHTHAVIWAKVQDPTGTWLALDARLLTAQAVRDQLYRAVGLDPPAVELTREPIGRTLRREASPSVARGLGL
jgi:hypothetical protein